MATRVGIGRSLRRDSDAAGREVAQQVMEALGGHAPSMVILFATMGHDQAGLVRAVREATDLAPLVGCSAEGILSRHGSEEQSHAVIGAGIASDEVTFRRFFVPGFNEDSAACGRTLAREILAEGKQGGLLVLFPDGTSGNCRDLLAAIEEELPNGPTIVGGTAGDTLTFDRTCQYRDDVVASGGVSALLIGGDVSAEIEVTHGCRLIGAERRVTRTDGGWLLEIDGQPAWDMFRGYLPEGASSLEDMHVAHLLLAEWMPRTSQREPSFVVRVPIKLDPKRRALYFAAGIPTGARVQLAIRDARAVCDHAREAATRLASRRPDEAPVLVLQLDCAGRGAILFGDATTTELTRPVQEVFSHDVPWIGLHTYGEIAKVGDRTSFHNYTAVLCALYPPPPSARTRRS